MSDTAERTTQVRTPRDQGQRNMVEAATRLLHRVPAEQITIRDIAEESGHHHRFVQAWFGGKVGLFLQVFDALNDQIARDLEPPFNRADFNDTIRITTSLMNWLVAADPESLSGPRPTPVRDRIAEGYRTTYGLDPELADMMALRSIMGSIAAMLFSGPLGIDEVDAPAMARLEDHLVQLLAASPPPDLTS